MIYPIGKTTKILIKKNSSVYFRIVSVGFNKKNWEKPMNESLISIKIEL
jgi:hypothetical protein